MDAGRRVTVAAEGEAGWVAINDDPHLRGEQADSAHALTLGRDGGRWRGLPVEDWLARFAGRTDDHAGSIPIFVGPRRRRADRVIRRKVEAA